jgi:hypothetical protein
MINGNNTKNQLTDLYPFLHSQLKKNVHNPAKKILLKMAAILTL